MVQISGGFDLGTLIQQCRVQGGTVSVEYWMCEYSLSYRGGKTRTCEIT